MSAIFLFPGNHSLTVSFLLKRSLAVNLDSISLAVFLIVIIPAVHFDCNAPSPYFELLFSLANILIGTRHFSSLN